jgi:hypothetical protein
MPVVSELKRFECQKEYRDKLEAPIVPLVECCGLRLAYSSFSTFHFSMPDEMGEETCVG